MLSLMKPDPQWAVCLEHSVLVFCPDAFIFQGTAAPVPSVKDGSGSRLLKFTAEFTEAVPFLKTHGKNFIEVSRPGAMEFLLRIKIFFSISILLFKEQFYVYRKIEERVQRFLIHLHAPRTGITSPVTNTSHQRGTSVTIRELHWHVRITQSPQFTSGFILGVACSIGMDKCTIRYIHHYNLIRSLSLL